MKKYLFVLLFICLLVGNSFARDIGVAEMKQLEICTDTLQGNEIFVHWGSVPYFLKGNVHLWMKEQVEGKNIPYTGKVMVRFHISQKGRLSHVRVGKTTEPRLNRIAVRLVRKMKHWKPGTSKNGKPVATDLNIIVNFPME